jgi:hypothetical protein
VGFFRSQQDPKAGLADFCSQACDFEFPMPAVASVPDEVLLCEIQGKAVMSRHTY